LPEAADFLSKLKLTDFPDDPSQRIWSRAQVAIRNAALVRITDRRERVEFLKGILTEGDYATSNGPAGRWAIEELCNSGAAAALPEIEHSVRKSGNGQRGEDDIEFCKARIQVVSRDPDRAKALASVLSLDGPPQDDRLVGWAVVELLNTHSVGANAELARFAAAVDKLPLYSQTRQRLWPYRVAIHSIPPSGPR
jgi:hypothetical protein